MEHQMVQEQRPQLKMKFLLGYNMKIVVLWEDENLVGGSICLGGGRLSKECADNWISVNFAIKALEIGKLLGVCFHSSQLNWEIYGNDFYVP